MTEKEARNYKLSKNFTLWEYLYSDKAVDNDLMDEQLKDVERVLPWLNELFSEYIQPIRDKVGKPMSITSGYRSPAVNKLVGGSKTSQHMVYEAVDLVVVGGSNKEIFDSVIHLGIAFNQMIWEYGDDQEPDWVHLGVRRVVYQNDYQLLRKYKGKSGYKSISDYQTSEQIRKGRIAKQKEIDERKDSNDDLLMQLDSMEVRLREMIEMVEEMKEKLS